MYIILNRTKKTTEKVEGNWPQEYLDRELEAGNDIIVISTYSDTIKVPTEKEEYGERIFVWRDFNIDIAKYMMR